MRADSRQRWIRAMATTLHLRRPLNMIQRALLRDLCALRQAADHGETVQERQTAAMRYVRTLDTLNSRHVSGYRRTR